MLARFPLSTLELIKNMPLPSAYQYSAPDYALESLKTHSEILNEVDFTKSKPPRSSLETSLSETYVFPFWKVTPEIVAELLSMAIPFLLFIAITLVTKPFMIVTLERYEFMNIPLAESP